MKPKPAAAAGSVFWAALPALLLCLPAPMEALYASRRYWFTEGAWVAHTTLVYWFVRGSAAAAVLLAAWRTGRERAAAALEAPLQDGARAEARMLAAATAGIFAFLLFLKLCQYRGFQLTQDSADTGNLAYRLAYLGSWSCTTLGAPNYLAVHFMPLVAVLAPLVRVWHDLRGLILFQTAALAAAPAAAYLLSARRSGSRLCGWTALWLVVTSPFFFNLASANVAFQVCLPALALWGFWFAESGRPRAAAACAVGLILTIEQTPFLLFGLGLYALLTRDSKGKRAGAAVCAGAAALWLLELKLMSLLPRGSVVHGGAFSHLAPTLPALAARAARAPWAVARDAFWPPRKLRPLWDLLASSGGACLLAPWEIAVWGFNLLPNLLSTGYYHDLRVHYSAYVAGPFWWGLALGLARAHGWLERRKLASWLLVFALAVGARNIYRGPTVLLQDWARSLYSEGPALAALIPDGASVWSTEYLAPRLSCGRRALKILHRTPDAGFATDLFLPDFVIVDRDWAPASDREARERVLGLLGREKYEKVGERAKLVLLRHPRAPLERDGEPPPLDLPPPDAEAGARAEALLRRDDDPAGTAALYRELAERGDAQGQANLGMMYSVGSGVPRDADQALRWWLAAAAQGDADSQAAAGKEYTQRGDWTRALPLFRAAAASGSRDAQYDLGIAFAAGLGQPKDLGQGIFWFRKSAEQGFVPAQFNLGVCLADAPPPLRDREQALSWLEKAAQRGYPNAKVKLEEVRRRPS